MEMTLTEAILFTTMKRHLAETPDVAYMNGYLWTPPERVEVFITNLNAVVGDCIREALGAPECVEAAAA